MELLVKCVYAEVMDAPVQVLEYGALHDCMRKVCFYGFERERGPEEESHPKVELRCQEIALQPRFEVGKSYALAVT